MRRMRNQSVEHKGKATDDGDDILTLPKYIRPDVCVPERNFTPKKMLFCPGKAFAVGSSALVRATDFNELAQVSA